ncbi:MAG: hypothetical protein ABIR58_04960 [Gemmatimonadaceae bacterium]
MHPQQPIAETDYDGSVAGELAGVSLVQTVPYQVPCELASVTRSGIQLEGELSVAGAEPEKPP